MSRIAFVVIALAAAGAVGFVVWSVRNELRRRRNLRHFEKGEPLEGQSDRWD